MHPRVLLIALLFLPFVAVCQGRKDTLRMIEEKYGEQWDFCTCVVQNDSITKQFMKSNLTDEEFDQLVIQVENIDQHCKAFLVISAYRTPEERAQHEQKVKQCLLENGNKK